MQSFGMSVFQLAIRLLIMLGMLLACSGCFQALTEDITDRCYDDIRIVERRGRISEDGKSLSIYQKKRTDYHRDPFGLWKGSFEEETSHTYPLDTPEPGAVLQDFDFTSREGYSWRHVHRLPLEIKNAETTELDYSAIRKFCREHQRAFPVLGGIEFPVPTQDEKKELRQAIEDYRTEQETAISREDAEDQTCGMR